MWNIEDELAPRTLTRRAGTGEVLLAEDVLAEVRRVAIATALAVDLAWRPGQSVEIEVAPRTWRRYLLAWGDRFAGRLEVVASLAAGGPGSWWAAVAGTGDPVRLRGLRDEAVLDARASRHLVLGDETAVGLHAALVRWLPAAHALDALIEVAPWAPVAMIDRDRPPFAVVPRQVAAPGVQLAQAAIARVDPATAVYVVGTAALVERVQTALRGRARSLRAIVTATA